MSLPDNTKKTIARIYKVAYKTALVDMIKKLSTEESKDVVLDLSNALKKIEDSQFVEEVNNKLKIEENESEGL
jgi:hypothetical protein